MNNKNAIAEYTDRYLKEINDLIAIIISDSEGVHIYSAFH